MLFATHLFERSASSVAPRLPRTVVTLAVVVMGCTGSGGTPAATPTPTSETTASPRPALDRDQARQLVLAAFEDVGQALIDLVPRRQEWVSGKLHDDVWRTLAGGARERMEDARGAISRLDVSDSRAVDLYLASLGLHQAAIDVDRAATELDEALRRETQKVGSRIRSLADRVFDFAQARLDLLPRGVDLADPVPSWDEFELVPRAPLVASDPDSVEAPTVDAEEWRRQLAVSSEDLEGHLRVNGISGALAFAHNLEIREAIVEDIDLPAKRTADSVGFRLALLLRAEALRIAVVDMSAPSLEFDLGPVAQRVLDLADRVDPLTAE